MVMPLFSSILIYQLISISCHSILINRLEKRVGIKGKALDWFKSYLENRQQCVNLNNTKSKSCALKFGVPRGSLLGPILFLLYTLSLVLKKSCISYHLLANNTQINMSFRLETMHVNIEIIVLLKLIGFFFFMHFFSQVRNIPERIILISTTGLR